MDERIEHLLGHGRPEREIAGGVSGQLFSLPVFWKIFAPEGWGVHLVTDLFRCSGICAAREKKANRYWASE